MKTLPVLFTAFLLLPSAHAKYGGGTGEPNDPYLIYTAEHLNSIGLHEEDWGKHFKLMADVDLGFYTGMSFNTIRTFSGVFDGGGQSISNFSQDCDRGSRTGSQQGLALFVSVSGANAVIRNVRLVNAEMNGRVGSPGKERTADCVGTPRQDPTSRSWAHRGS